MNLDDLLNLYYQRKIDIKELSKFLDGIKIKIMNLYPQIDFKIYNYLFDIILKECLEKFRGQTDFIKYYYEELKKEFKKINTSLTSKEDKGLEQIFRHPILSKEEINELFIRYNKGDIKAKELIIKHHYRLVRNIALKYNHDLRSFALDDLFQEGVIGLIRAIDKFDVTLGYNFSTYATYWIMQAIQKSIMNYDNMIKIPDKTFSKFKNICEIKANLEQKLNREATVEELAIALKVPIQELVKYLNMGISVDSINRKIKEDETNERGFFLKSGQNIEEDYLKKESIEEVRKILLHLNPKERQVIMLRAGLGYDRKYTLEEIGSILGLTRERVRQIQNGISIKINRLNLINEKENDRQLSINVTKVRLNDYFLGVSTSELNRFIKTLPTHYQRIIFKYYDKDLILIENGKLEPIFIKEIIPYMFYTLIETTDGKIKPLINYFVNIDLATLQEYLNRNKMEIIYKRYGQNLNELNPITPKETKKLYAKLLPHLYNYYLSKKPKDKPINDNTPLITKYQLAFEELELCIKKLSIKDIAIIYNVYGTHLNSFNIEYYNANVIAKLDEVINLYLKEKRLKQASKTTNGEVEIISKPKSFLEKYYHYDLVILKDIINQFPNNNLFYERYGNYLTELNELNLNKRKKLLYLVKEFENIYSTLLSGNKVELTNKLSLLEIYNTFTKKEIINAIKLLDITNQQVIFKIYGINLNETNNYFAGNLELFNSAMKRLREILIPDISLTKGIVKKKTGKKGKTIIEIYSKLSIEELKTLIDMLNDKYKEALYQCYGTNLDDYLHCDDYNLLVRSKKKLEELIILNYGEDYLLNDNELKLERKKSVIN